MYDYKNLLVPLNLTTIDDAAVRFAAQISQIFQSKRLHFLHVKRPSGIPQGILDEYPELVIPSIEERKQQMQAQIKATFKGHQETKIFFDVKEGRPLEVLLAQIAKRDIDLVVIGRKKDAVNTRRLPVNLARKAPCSVLVVPEKSDATLTKILTPIDFSEFCISALERSINLAVANDIATIHVLHVFQLPLGYYKTGKSQEEFTEIMTRNASRDFERFIKNIDLKGVSINPIFVRHEQPATVIQNVVEENGIDIVVLGTRGRKAGAGLLLGSVTEDVILKTTCSILAVKKKGTGLSFLEVLLKYV